MEPDVTVDGTTLPMTIIQVLLQQINLSIIANEHTGIGLVILRHVCK